MFVFLFRRKTLLSLIRCWSANRVADPGGVDPDPAFENNLIRFQILPLKNTPIYFNIKGNIIEILILYCNLGQYIFRKNLVSEGFWCSDRIRIRDILKHGSGSDRFFNILIWIRSPVCKKGIILINQQGAGWGCWQRTLTKS